MTSLQDKKEEKPCLGGGAEGGGKRTEVDKEYSTQANARNQEERWYCENISVGLWGTRLLCTLLGEVHV